MPKVKIQWTETCNFSGTVELPQDVINKLPDMEDADLVEAMEGEYGRDWDRVCFDAVEHRQILGHDMVGKEDTSG